MKSPQISIIIPVYNVEQYLDKCIQSILNQTLRDIEIILVDDGSPDSCPKMCDEYAKKDNRIKVIHKKNAGLGFARNSGLEIATGEYVAFVDSDDFIDTTMYEHLYNEAQNKHLDTVYCSWKKYYNDNDIIDMKDVDSPVTFYGKQQVDTFLLDIVAPDPDYPHDVKYMMGVCHAIYSLKLIKLHSIKFCSERQFVSEDLIFDIDYLSKATAIEYLPDTYYYYRYNPTSLSSTYTHEKFEKNKVFLQEVMRKLKLLFPYNVYYIHVARLAFIYLRISILQEFITLKKEPYRTKIKYIKDLVSDSFFCDILNKYPYWKLPFKHKCFFIMWKWKCTTGLLLICKFKSIFLH